MPTRSGPALSDLKAKWFTPAEKTAKRSALWKDTLRGLVGPHGDRAWANMIKIANGEAWVPKMEDGREGPPEVPTTGDRLEANQFILTMLFGKAPTQERIAEAERAAAENSDLHTMSDAELEARVKQMLVGSLLEGETDAETEASPGEEATQCEEK